MDNAIEEIVPGEQAAAPAPQRLIEFVLPMVIVAVDQATKAMVRASVPVHDSVTIIPGFLDITHALNSGAAFGILNGADFPYKTVMIAVIATAALIGVGFLRRQPGAPSADRALRPGADHRRRGRQPHRSGAQRLGRRLSSTSTGKRIISGRSTSPTRRFRSASPC